jgi:ring-1,2-phenylacetyl-CoA epoxidase subunit PaaD
VSTRVRRDVRMVAASVTDPELPMLTLADLGILRHVHVDAGGHVVVTVTPTYSGCPAMGAMRAELTRAVADAGYPDVEVRVALDPPWSTDWITPAGRRKLARAGIAPPEAVAPRPAGPVPLNIGRRLAPLPCPQCGSSETEERSRFSATACRSLWRCRACGEPFEHLKAI